MIVSVKNLVKRYGDLIALDHFSMEVEEGEIYGLLGPNGSGKTTAINCILSLLKYDKGTIEVFGKPMNPDSYESKRNIGVVMQNVAVLEELTVYENIDYFCGLYVSSKSTRRDMVRDAVRFTGLQDYEKFYPKKLSGGLLRRLNIACGIAHRPKLIIMDEPTVAVDPQSRNSILEGIEDLNRNGATVMYTSHYMEEVEQICSKIAIMDKGKIIASGTNSQLKDMIRTGEKITVELPGPDEKLLGEIKNLRHIKEAGMQGSELHIISEHGSNNLAQILEHLSRRNVPYGKVYCELPTLNDVFLEITGKELRD